MPAQSGREAKARTLAAEFVAHSLGANAVFWALIGLFLAHAFAYVERKHP